jgi:hypothetical protein
MPTTNKTFAPEAANRSLVLVKRVVADVVVCARRLADLHELAEAARSGGSLDASRDVQLELSNTAGRLKSCLDELDDIGVVLTDEAAGIVDFPCLADGTEVCLFWRLGEPAVGAWHELGESCLTRQPLRTLPAEPILASARAR